MDNDNTDSLVISIKPINVDTVHKICSGQVVLNLAIAVKELVENALDAGATCIDVRLKNYGIDLIEITDNGVGVSEDNFASLAQKYHTSKLNDYSDLLGVTSFGFRGEALSSLCALGNIVITTRHSSAALATKIEYDDKGNIVTKTPCSRQVGTTVSLSNLFSTLPVRQKEFHRNAKREFAKMTQLLYAYCLVSLGVKISCSNTTSTNSKTVVVATQASSSYKDNIACVFGSKQLQNIVQLKPEYVTSIKSNILKGLSMEVQEIDENIKIDDVEINLSEESNDADNDEINSSQNSSQSLTHNKGISPVNFTGFISSCAHGSGRSSTDRQFYYVNSRPCEPTKIIKLINEVYRQYNPNQYPFVFLNVDLDRSLVDVNVTPDKRKIFLTKEKIILEAMKVSLIKAFENIPRTLKVDSINTLSQNGNCKEPNLSQPRVFNSFLQKFANKCNQSSKNQDVKISDLKRKSTTILNYVSKTIKTQMEDISDNNICNGDHDDQNKKYLNEEIKLKCENDTDNKEFDEHINISKIDTDTSENNLHNGDHDDQNKIYHKYEVQLKYDNDIIDTNNIEFNEHINISKNYTKDDTPEDKSLLNSNIIYLESTDNLPTTQIRKLDDVILDSHTIVCKTKVTKRKSPKKNDRSLKHILTDKDDLRKLNKKSVVLKTSLRHVEALCDIYNKQNKNKVNPNRIRFRSQINPVFNKKCEDELSREISKNSFKEMIVVGQFNLGFIITRLDEDLFIIDQHATDEIYNFETLQKTTELTSQKLVLPQQLELTTVNEQILTDNLDIFKKNGFTFEIDSGAQPTKRVKLLTLPMSKNWVFGKDDIEELLFMLRESPNEECRPSRVRAMFASRACRKSVMIGTALSKPDMKTLVNHMAEIDKPWNCPHGRPTIRHLVNLAMVQIKE